jgi:hypothetical protein
MKESADHGLNLQTDDFTSMNPAFAEEQEDDFQEDIELTVGRDKSKTGLAIYNAPP